MRATTALLTLAGSCLLAASVRPTPSAAESKPATLAANEVLDRMGAVYARCKSYRDAGVNKIVYFLPRGNQTDESPFKTAFVRPDRFRFEYQEPFGQDRKLYRRIFWGKGKEVRTWRELRPDVEQPESLSVALKNAEGSTFQTSMTVPALLNVTTAGWWRGLEGVKRLEDAKLDKTDCVRIEGTYQGFRRILWIDPQTFLLRRMDFQPPRAAERKAAGDYWEVTITCAATVDEDIPDKELEFDPPGKK